MSEQAVIPPYAIRRRWDGHRQVIELCGEIDVLAAPPGSDFLRDALGCPGAEADTVIDLRGVTFIDGSGLNALLRTADRLHACRHDLTIVVTNPFHRRLLRLIDLGPNVTVRTDLPDTGTPPPSPDSARRPLDGLARSA
ncbi:STAS domain-containing protein [Streptomyces panaciradicis]|uniref:STAS domain-containing protein n=1 Tax=Streptomyces panaciradicis TaxID=1470261 RepID=UPI00201D07CE|nr:STAS domain-containing protein [Streptomyces panaciradicis]MCL6670157.1 STAS domain-containing protein [Streptomyces panaciradicis]